MRRSASTATSTWRCAASWRRAPTRSAAALAAKGFGFGGVPRERAYHDALRDLAVPAMGHPPLVRITVLDDDPEGAYAAWDRGRPSPRR